MPKVEQKFFSRLLFLLFGAGAALCLYLFLLAVNREGGGLCTLLGSDCLGVTQSAYGSWLGFSVASCGLAYFALQLGLVACGRSRGESIFIWRALFTLNLAAVAVSIWFIVVMLGVLHESCIACFAVHGVNGLSLLVLIKGVADRRGAVEKIIGPPAQPGGRLPFPVSPLLFALAVFLAANLHATRNDLDLEKKKLGENLGYFQYLYRNAPFCSLQYQAGDLIIGNDSEATHGIVLIYKDGCRHCRQAREKLAALVRDNPAAFYLVLKNHERLSAEELERLEISRLPAVFINGKRADGWDLPGFWDEFAEACGC